MDNKDKQEIYFINGVKLYFPLKAYNTQLSVMSHITKALKMSQNCLIESPTGTGKTLALLCSTLAWLCDERARQHNSTKGSNGNPSEYFGEYDNNRIKDNNSGISQNNTGISQYNTGISQNNTTIVDKSINLNSMISLDNRISQNNSLSNNRININNSVINSNNSTGLDNEINYNSMISLDNRISQNNKNDLDNENSVNNRIKDNNSIKLSNNGINLDNNVSEKNRINDNSGVNINYLSNNNISQNNRINDNNSLINIDNSLSNNKISQNNEISDNNRINLNNRISDNNRINLDNKISEKNRINLNNRVINIDNSLSNNRINLDNKISENNSKINLDNRINLNNRGINLDNEISQNNRLSQNNSLLNNRINDNNSNNNNLTNCLINGNLNSKTNISSLNDIKINNLTNSNRFNDIITNNDKFNNIDLNDDLLNNNAKLGKSEKIRIFYCTRTHRQIAQVVSELKRTVFAPKIKMAILSSRKQSCLNPAALRSRSVTDTCRQLNAKNINFGAKCPFYQNINLSDKHSKIKRLENSNCWDLEEFVDICQNLNSCPYYSSQKLAEKADLIFAPYNYIMNPLIKEQMSIDLKNAIVILDEAHNVEDICRSSMSSFFYINQLLAVFKEISLISNYLKSEEKYSQLKNSYFIICGFVSTFSNWVKSQETFLAQKSFSEMEKVFTGLEAKISLNNFFNYTDKYNSDDNFNNVLNSYKNIFSSFTSEDYTEIPKPSEICQNILSSLILTLEYLLIKSTKFFVVSLSKGTSNTSDFETSNSANLLLTTLDDEKNSQKITQSLVNDIKVSFICLSPSLAFNCISRECRSILLASGTLSPISSFAPELGTPFDVSFQTSNYLQANQALILSLGVDTFNNPLKLTYQYIDLLKHQDEVGKILVSVINIIPGGVLVFFPSYTVMDKFCRRWETTDINKQMSKSKAFFCEKRGMTTGDVDEMINSYFKYCKITTASTGAILFAVCRGRISEGIDFRDDRARAVITLGIPYPNIKVLDIERKMAFNDEMLKNQNTKNMLCGREWYNTQAFRALNQALGRCIRHRNDWGAIIMIDGRLNLQDNAASSNYLSCWVRKHMEYCNSYQVFMNSLKKFFDSKKDLIVVEDPVEQENEIPSHLKSRLHQAFKSKYYSTQKSSGSKGSGLSKKKKKQDPFEF